MVLVLLPEVLVEGMFSSLWLQESRYLVVKNPICGLTASLLARIRR